MTKKTHNLDDFRNEIYGEDDALFDGAGTNVSRQVENAILKREKALIKEMVGEVERMRLAPSEVSGGYSVINKVLKILKEKL